MSRAGIPLPVELALSLIDYESGGIIGNTNQSSGASGLMQVMPGTLADYNKRHALKVPLSVLRSREPEAARSQIRVGLWVLTQFWRGTYNYLRQRSKTISTDDLARIADLYYAAGPGITRKKLGAVSAPTFAALAAANPTWKAISHAERVFKRLDSFGPVAWRMDEISDWLDRGGPGEVMTRPPVQGFILAAIVLLLGLWWLKKSKGKNDGDKEDRGLRRETGGEA